MTTISVYKKVGLLGMEQEINFQFSQEEVKTILNVLLESQGYVVTNLLYDDGIQSHWEGYGMGEHEVKKAYFNGVFFEVIPKKGKPKSKGLC